MYVLVSNFLAALSLILLERGVAATQQRSPTTNNNPELTTWSPTTNRSSGRRATPKKTTKTTITSTDGHNERSATTKILRNTISKVTSSDAEENHVDVPEFDASKEVGVLAESPSRALPEDEEEPSGVVAEEEDEECHGDRPVIGDGLQWFDDNDDNDELKADTRSWDWRFWSLVRDCVHFENDACPYRGVPLGCWNTSKITSMRLAFESLNQRGSPSVPLRGIASWDTSSVTDMAFLFSNAETFDVPLDSWNTSSVKSMEGMFSGAKAFNQPIGSWDTSSLRNMNRMFDEASSFNQPIGSWNVSGVTTARMAFRDARAFNQPLGEWDVSSIETQSDAFALALRNAKSFNQCLSEWSSKLPLGWSHNGVFLGTSCPYQLDESRDCDDTRRDCDESIVPWCQGPEQGCYDPSSGRAFFASEMAAVVPTLALLLLV